MCTLTPIVSPPSSATARSIGRNHARRLMVPGPSGEFEIETEEILGRADSPPLAAAVEFARKTGQTEQDQRE